MNANVAIYLCLPVLFTGLLISCKEPKLVQDSDSQDNSKKPTRPVSTAVAPPRKERQEIETIRKDLAGQRFHTLTLADRKYSNVQLHQIDDQAISFSHAGGEEKISWDEVDTIVKEKWGYDPVAFMKLSHTDKAEAAPAPSEPAATKDESSAKEEYYALLLEEENRKKEIRKQREALFYEAKDLRAKVAEAETELRRLMESKWELEDGYSKQDSRKEQVASSRYDEESDNDRIGGVSTSQVDRNKALEKWNEKIRIAESKVDTLRLKLKETEKRLSMISRVD